MPNADREILALREKAEKLQAARDAVMSHVAAKERMKAQVALHDALIGSVNASGLPVADMVAVLNLVLDRLKGHYEKTLGEVV